MALVPNSQQFFLNLIWRAYLQRLQTNPICTKAVTSCILNLLGDTIAQKFERIRPQDMKRTLRFGLFGLLVTGPLLHFWYHFLDRLFQNRKSLSALILRILLDQFIFSPLFHIIYYIYLCILEGNMKYLKFRIVRNLGPTFSTQLKIWPAAQIINFRFVPVELQVLFSNIVALVWTVYFSLLNHKKI